MADKPPLIVEDRVEAFLDEHGLGCGPGPRATDRRRGRLELHLPARARRRAIRAPPAAAAAAAAFGARHGARGRAADRDSRCRLRPPRRDRRGLRRRERARRAVLRDALPRRPRDHARAACRASRPRSRAAALGLDLVDTLVEIHAADVEHARRSSAFARPGSYLERQVQPLRAALGAQPDARASGSGRGRPLPDRTHPRAAPLHRRPRRLSPREHDGGTERPDAHPRRARLGDGSDRRSRAPTSATCSRPTASRTGASARSARRR